MEALGDDRLQRRPGERVPAGEHLVEDAAECEEVGAAVHRVARCLLRAHVRRRADRDTHLREGRRLRRRSDHRLADPEVRDDRVPLVQQDVLGLDVAMDDVVAVRVVERVGHLAHDSHRLLDRQGAVGLHSLPQREPLHHRHHVEQEAVGFSRVVQGKDVRVRQSRREPDLTHEALASEGFGEVGLEHLDGHRAVVLEVVREVHGGHASHAELALDAVPVGQGQ